MNKRIGAMAVAFAALSAAAGLLAGASSGAPQPPNCDIPWGCLVQLTATGPSPRTLTMHALGNVHFTSGDLEAHKVVFANGLCSLTVHPGTGPQGCTGAVFMEYAGVYGYTVDGTSKGKVVTTPLPRAVSLTARTHTIRGGTRLAIHGEVVRRNTCTWWSCAPPPPVVVLARHDSRQPFKPIATVRTRGARRVTYGWKLVVRPETGTTYVAEVTMQRVCYFPASRCAHPQGQVWANARSRPFAIRIRKGPR